MFTKTFRLSPFTTFLDLLRASCSFWGVIMNDFAIYQLDEDPLKKPINLSNEKEKVI